MKFPEKLKTDLPYVGFPGSSVVKNLFVTQETHEMLLQSLGWEDPLEEGMATHSSILDWRIPMGRGAWWATLMFVTPCSPRGRKESHVTEVTKHSGWCDVLIPFGCLSFQVS